MAETVYTRGGGNITIVPSFSTPDKSYVVKGGVCNCPAQTKGRGCVKHVAVAPAFERIERLPFGDGEKARLRDRVLDLARRTYTRPRKDETASASYDLYYAVLTERYASEALRERAKARHRLVVERCFERMGRAA